LIATADYLSEFQTATDLGVHLKDDDGVAVTDARAELGEVNTRVLDLAIAQSEDIESRLREVGVRVLRGAARLLSASRVEVTEDGEDGTEQLVDADVVLLATGATPRVMASAQPDGERILTW